MTDRSSFLDGVYDFTLGNLRTLKARWRDFAGDRNGLPAILSDGDADRPFSLPIGFHGGAIGRIRKRLT